MDIKCPHCLMIIPVENLNVQTSIAKCDSCRAIFGFSGQVSAESAFKSSKRFVAMPENYTLSVEGRDLVLVRRWFAWRHIFILFFCIAWDSFLVTWYTAAFRPHAPLILKLFPLPHLVIGVIITYSTLAGLLNSTKVTLNTGGLSIKHYPLPWLGDKVLQRRELSQLFCEEKRDYNRHGPQYSYTLSAVMPGGKKLKLISGMDEPEDALFVEQKIEGFLGIADRPVAGEMRPI